MADPVQLANRKYRNVLQTAVLVVREEGLSALYKGVVPTVMRQGINQAVNFTTYQAVKTAWMERQVRFPTHPPTYSPIHPPTYLPTHPPT